MAKQQATPQTVDAPEDMDIGAQLAQLGVELQKVKDDKEAKAKKLQEIEDVLGSISIKDFPELAESPVVQNIAKMLGVNSLRPGQVAGIGTLAEREREWTWGDLNALDENGNRIFPLKRFTPTETIPITFNGLCLQLIADQECEAPEPFYNIYREHREAIRQARVHEAYLMGKSPIPPHPNWQTVEGAEVRMWSTQGEQYGKKSGYVGVGPISEEEGESGES